MHRMRDLADRFGTADPARRGVVTAVVLAAAIGLELGFSSYLENPWITYPAIPVFVAPLLFAHRAPRIALLVAMAVLSASELAGAAIAEAFGSFLVAVYLVWNVGTRVERTRDVLVTAGAAIAMLLTLIAAVDDATVSDLLWAAVLIVVLPLVGSRLMRSNTRLSAVLSERARSLEAERDERAGLAAAQERERIAAELHDVVAHGVSAMVIQASAARRLVARGADPEMSRDAIAEVEASGRAALDELRRLLGVLRRGDEALALEPQPSLARIDRLVDRLRDEGLPIELVVEGERGTVPAGLDVTAYRILEEALAEVLRQDEPVVTRVAVRYRPRELELEVTDDGGPRRHAAGPEDGLGLRERVALFGGSLHTGRRRGGGWSLQARLPIDREAA